MRDYGYVLSNTEIYSEVDRHVHGLIILAKEGQLDVELPEMITATRVDENNTENEQTRKGRTRLLLAREGKVDIDRIYLTAQYQETADQIEQFQSNPFMPASIQSELSKLLSEIRLNLATILPQVIRKAILGLVSTECSPDNPIGFDPLAVYNEFQRIGTHHEDTIRNTVKLIRAYLMVDRKWN